MTNRVILPGATLGVMGGGQLGRMFAHAAQQMGYFTAVLDPDASSPAGLVSHHHVVDFPARLFGHLCLLVKGGVPARIAHE